MKRKKKLMRLYNDRLEYTEYTRSEVLPAVRRAVARLFGRFREVHPHDMERLISGEAGYQVHFPVRKP